MFDLRTITGFGLAFIAGGLVGYALARTWWSALALYVVGLALCLWALALAVLVLLDLRCERRIMAFVS